MNIKTALGTLLVIVSIIFIGMALNFGGWVGIVFAIVALDLLCTVFYKPLFGPGLIAKHAYHLENQTDNDYIL